jgi:hypothetical protein
MKSSLLFAGLGLSASLCLPHASLAQVGPLAPLDRPSFLYPSDSSPNNGSPPGTNSQGSGDCETETMKAEAARKAASEARQATYGVTDWNAGIAAIERANNAEFVANRQDEVAKQVCANAKRDFIVH